MSNFYLSILYLLTLKCLLANDYSFIYCDASEPWQKGFQDPATDFMEQIIDFHDHLMFFILVIGVLVSWLLYKCLDFSEDKNYERSYSIGDSLISKEVW